MYTGSRCRYCEKQASVKLPYAKLNLCIDHFREFIESRVGSTIRRYKIVKPGERILLAVSGGKDSISLANIMHKISSTINLKLVVLHIDLNIGEYSRRSRGAVEGICRRLGLEYIVVDLKNDLGFTLPDFVSRLRTRRVCSLCGIVKRYIMNAVAIESNADAIATAHHADDVLTYILKNFVLQDYSYMKKLLPINRGIPGIVATKIKPLYETYERDLALYAKYSNLDFVDMECPYKKENSMEITIRRFIEDLEDRSPGIKVAILRKFAKTHLAKAGDIEGYRSCSLCGLVSQGDRCVFCKLTEKCFGRPLGPSIREIIRQKLSRLC